MRDDPDPKPTPDRRAVVVMLTATVAPRPRDTAVGGPADAPADPAAPTAEPSLAEALDGSDDLPDFAPTARAFRAWLDEVRPRLRYEVTNLNEHDGRVSFGLGVGGGAFEGHVNRLGLSVAVVIEGVCWDLIFDLDTLPVAVPGGWTCGFCLPEWQAVHATPEALWRAHTFEPFLTWINGDLAEATHLALLGGFPEGYTEAVLVRSADAPRARGATHLLPLAPLRDEAVSVGDV